MPETYSNLPTLPPILPLLSLVTNSLSPTLPHDWPLLSQTATNGWVNIDIFITLVSNMQRLNQQDRTALK